MATQQTTTYMMTNEEAKALEAQATVMEAEAAALAICDEDTYRQAADLKIRIKDERERILAKPLEKKVDAHGVWNFLNDICKMIQKPFDRAEEAVDGKMIAYRREIEVKRMAEQRRAEEKAMKLAQEARQKDIEAAKAAGDREGAKNLKAAPLAPMPIAVKTPEPPKIKGMPVRRIWKFTIIDPLKIPRKFLIVDEVAVRKVVNALGANHGIPGVVARQEEIQ